MIEQTLKRTQFCAYCGKRMTEVQNNSNFDETIQKIADHYGLQAQGRQTIEECAELIVALNHYFRCPDIYTKGKISEEMADVQIMIFQLEKLLGNLDEVDALMNRKLDRQIRRIKQDNDL